MTKPTDNDGVLERNVETLLETGGEAPKLSDAARSRIRANLIARHGREAKQRSPWIAVGVGLAATAAAALIVTRFVGSDEPSGSQVSAVPIESKLADGSTWVAHPGAKVTQLGPRRVRVEGAALLDVVPGKGMFVVETARGRIEVIGTRFLVDAVADRTTAAVVRGQVKLATADGEVLLHAGEQGVAEPGRPPTRGPAPRLSHLVSWAAQARKRDEKTVTPLRTGTLFARDPGVRGGQMGPEYPLPLKKLGVDIVVEDQVARVALDQTFHNNEGQVLEGVYRFAIPPDAALQRLAMYVDGKLTESAVVERQRARRIYEELVYRRVDPALLEWAGNGRLSLRVYPLPAHQDKRLMLAYTQSLPKLYSDWTLSVPLPEIDEPVAEVAFDVTVRGCANCEITSTSHKVAVARKGEDAVVTYRNQSEKIGDSLVLHVRDARQQTTVAAHDSYLMVRSPANLERKAREYRPRTWVILDDVSASRSALERKAQADLIDAFVRELDEEDKLGVIAFDVTARNKLAPTRVLDVDRRALRKSLDGEGDVGATDFGVALEAAKTMLAGVAPDDAMLVYLGDGVITSGARNLDALRNQLTGKARFVGVGVGDGPDTQTLETLAAATGGYATTIDLADDVGWRAFDLVAALHTTRVTGLEARLVDASGSLVPSTLYLRSPQLADGEELELVAKLAGTGRPVAVELTGTMNGEPWTRRLALDTKGNEGGYLPRLWAQRHIAARMLAKHEAVVVPPCTGACKTEAQVREARDEAIRNEVVALGKQYFLLSRHTSLIVLENDAMYAQYGVTKGAGDTWAPYTIPATIPVVTTAPTVKPLDVADDAELERAPLQVFYNYGGYFDFSGLDAGGTGWGTIGTGRFGTIGHGSGTGQGFGVGGGGGGSTRATLGLVLDAQVQDKPQAPMATSTPVSGAVMKNEERSEPDLDADREMNFKDDLSAAQPAEEKAKRQSVSSDEVTGGFGSSMRGRGNQSMFWDRQQSMAGPMVAQRLTHANDAAFDDLTSLVPALFPDASDGWRKRLTAGASTKPYPIEAAARTLLANARKALPVGLYRWDELEIAVDGARRLGWRRTTEADLAETASFDGTTWTRRYAELGIDVTRSFRDDDVALSLAYLPMWIAEPAHYARYFEVRAAGPRTVTLSRPVNGKSTVVFALELDDRHRLVAIRDADGNELVAITWGDVGPTSARVMGETVSVGFTGQAISDATTWAHGSTQAQRVIVELPARLPAYWQTKVAKETAGSPSWRHAQRQLMVSLAAVNNRVALASTFDALRTSGGVELGDLTLASGGITTATNDAQFATSLAGFTTTPIARYLMAGRAYAKSPQPDRLRPELTAGLIGALWQLREITALVAANKATIAIDRLVAMGNRALQLRLIAASITTNRYELKAEQLGRAWDTVAVGRYRNIARAQAAQAMANRGSIEEAANRIAALVEDLDLTADPPQLAQLSYYIQQSRRGQAGWQMIWSTWRDRVLAGTSFEHVMSLVALNHYGQQQDVTPMLTRAVELAGTNIDRKVMVARAAIQRGMTPFAQTVIEPFLKTNGTRELYQLAGYIAMQQSRLADALAHYEAAQAAAGDEAVDLATVRNELAHLINVARQLAMSSSGAARDKAVERAMMWGNRWRAIDAGNPQIDQQLGELMLAVGNQQEAWRQLSSVIERDPMAGTGYQLVAETFERQGKVADAIEFWQQAIVIDQTNPTHRLRKAQALIAIGRTQEGDALLTQVANGKWHDIWSGVAYQAKYLLERSKQPRR